MASSSKSKDHKEEEAKKSEKKQFPSQTRYIAFLVLAIIVVMSVAIGTIWAVVKPKRPYVVVQNGYITEKKITDTTLSGRLHFDISFYNPNKKATIYFDNLTASSSFSDKTETIGSLNKSLNITPHHQFPISFQYKSPEFWSLYGYMEKYLNQGHITRSILFKAKIRFGFAKWKSLSRTINIYCMPLVVFESDGDVHTFKPTVCKVDY